MICTFFNVLHCIFGSMTHLDGVLHEKWCLGIFSCTWISSVHDSTICGEEGLSFLCWIALPSLPHSSASDFPHRPLASNHSADTSFFPPIPQCLDDYSFISLQTGDCELSKLLFQNCFDYLIPLLSLQIHLGSGLFRALKEGKNPAGFSLELS